MPVCVRVEKYLFLSGGFRRSIKNPQGIDSWGFSIRVREDANSRHLGTQMPLSFRPYILREMIWNILVSHAAFPISGKYNVQEWLLLIRQKIVLHTSWRSSGKNDLKNCISMAIINLLSSLYRTAERGCCCMELIISFLLSIVASVVGNYISKWLDRNSKDS